MAAAASAGTTFRASPGWWMRPLPGMFLTCFDGVVRQNRLRRTVTTPARWTLPSGGPRGDATLRHRLGLTEPQHRQDASDVPMLEQLAWGSVTGSGPGCGARPSSEEDPVTATEPRTTRS